MHNVLDQLNKKTEQPEEKEEELVIPKKCAECKNVVVCNVIYAFSHVTKLGIQISVDSCPYHNPIT